MSAVKSCGFALNYASDRLKNDREMLLEAVKAEGRVLEYVSDDLKNHRKICYVSS